jgi:nitroreductase
MKSFLDLAHDRYSVRRISSAPVEQEKLEQILEAGMAAPTAHNNQPVKIFLLQSEEAKRKLAEANSFPFVQDAPAAFVIGSDAETGWVREYDGMNFADVDAAIVTTHMLLEIHDLGLGSTWCGHFDAGRLKELFPEMAAYNLIAVLPVGYPAETAHPSRLHTARKSREETVTGL